MEIGSHLLKVYPLIISQSEVNILAAFFNLFEQKPHLWLSFYNWCPIIAADKCFLYYQSFPEVMLFSLEMLACVVFMEKNCSL